MSDERALPVIDGHTPILKPEVDGDRVRIMAANREDLYLTHEGQWRSTLIDDWPTQEAAEAFLRSLSPAPTDKLDAGDREHRRLIEHVASEAAQFFSEDVDGLSEVEKAQMANTIAERAALTYAARQV